MLEIKPNFAQIEALKEVNKKRSSGINKGTVILPTGVGKTFFVAMDANRIKPKKLLYIAHQDQILKQAMNTFERISNRKTSFYIQNEKNISENTFATIQTMRRNYLKLPKNLFDYIVIDECHHSQAISYKKVLNYFKPKYLMGLTATPYRTDNKDIFKIVGNPYYKMKLSDAIDLGLLAKINYYYVDNDINFSKIKRIDNRYDEKDLNKKLLIPKYDKAIIKEFKKHAINKKTIVFCATVEHTERLQKVFQNQGINAVNLHSKMKKEKRNSNLQKFLKNESKVILVRDLFNEGVDIPDCECVIMLRPTESKIIFEQQLGRGLRKTKSKGEVLILDFTANSFNNKFNLDLLNEASSGKIFKEIYEKLKNGNKKDLKELFIYDDNFKIRLNRTKIDILRGFAFSIEQRKDLLTNHYLQLKKQLKHPPSAIEIEKYSRGYGFGRQSYEVVFGSWSDFKKSVGDSHLIQKEKVIKQLVDFKNEKGHFPTDREGRKYHLVSGNTIRSIFGSYEKALEEAGGKREIKKHMNLSKERILTDFYNCKKSLKRTPTYEELEKYSGYCYVNGLKNFFKTGSYHKFLDIIGEKRSEKSKIDYIKGEFKDFYKAHPEFIGYSYEYKKASGKKTKKYLRFQNLKKRYLKKHKFIV